MPIIPFLFSFFFIFLSLFIFILSPPYLFSPPCPHLLSQLQPLVRLLRILIFLELPASQARTWRGSASSRPQAVATPLCRPCRPSRLLQPPPPCPALRQACLAACASPALQLGFSAASTLPGLRRVCSVCLRLAHTRRKGSLGRAHMPGRRSRRKPVFSAPALSRASSQRVFQGFFEGAER